MWGDAGALHVWVSHDERRVSPHPKHPKSPCANCPYRVDAPKRLWHREEFEKLLESEQELLGKLYACHKQSHIEPAERGLCAGWLLDQKRRGVPSNALRIALLRDSTVGEALAAVWDGGHKLYATVKQMCRANGVRR